MNAQIDTKLSPAVRQRKGDYIQGPDSDNGEWRIGRITDKVAGHLIIEDSEGAEGMIPKHFAYKATREEFENPKEVEEMEENNEHKIEAEEIDELKSQNLGAEEEEVRPVRIHPDWSRYVRHTGITTQSGKTVVDIDDYVAGILRGLNLDDTYDTVARYIQKINETAVDSKGMETLDTIEKLRAKYGHLNPGMQRMNLGNKLRGALARAGMDTLPEIPWTQE